jgi:DUF971 family protein
MHFRSRSSTIRPAACSSCAGRTGARAGCRTACCAPEAASSIRLAAIHAVSDKGLNLAFSDGHGRGIFPWAYLRELGLSATS